REEMRIDFVLDGGLRDATKIHYSAETQPTVERRSGEVRLLGRIATATVSVHPASDVGKVHVSGTVLNDADRPLARFETDIAIKDRPAQAVTPQAEGGGIAWPIWVGIALAVVGAG